MNDGILKGVAPNRRDFLTTVASAAAGLVVGGRGLVHAALGASQGAPPARRRATIGGRRITVVDIHAHTFVPEVWDLVKDTPSGRGGQGQSHRRDCSRPGTADAPAVHGQGGHRLSGDQRERLGLRGGPRARARPHSTAEREDRGGRGEESGPLRGHGHAVAAAPGHGGRSARPGRQEAGPARRRDRRQRRRPGAVGPEVRSVLGEGRRARA